MKNNKLVCCHGIMHIVFMIVVLKENVAYKATILINAFVMILMQR